MRYGIKLLTIMTIAATMLLTLPQAMAAADEGAPKAFDELAVTLVVPGGTLYGTELLPRGKDGQDGAKPPLVILHAGSGPTDRDGNSRVLPGANNSLRQLAEALARRGVASVRYDKRLIGASVSPQWTEPALRFDDYVDDIVAWTARLRADARFSRIVLAGHSEGALIVVAACGRAHADGCVSISGAGHSSADILAEQLRGKLPPALLAQNERILGLLKQGQPAPDVPPELAALYRPSVQPYLISWMKYDPRALAGALTMPLLIVQGTSDIQVSVAEARALAGAAPRARLLIVDGMNHVLKMVGDDAALQQRSYSSPDLPVAPQLVEALGAFATAPLSAANPPASPRASP